MHVHRPMVMWGAHTRVCEGVGRDGSPEGFDSIGGTAEFTNHISTYKEGVGRDGSPEGFDSIRGTAEFTNHNASNIHLLNKSGWGYSSK